MKEGKETERFKEAPLKALFIEELETIYWVENHLLKALPQLGKKTNSNETRQAFQNHIKCIRENISRLEKIFTIINLPPKGRISNPTKEILKNCDEIVARTDHNGMARESGLLIYGHKLAHYQIAGYAALATLSKTLQLDDNVLNTLKVILQEEKAMSTLLYSIGESHVNMSNNDEPKVE